MKIRKGFVSNSSSSSFICRNCSKEETTYNYDGEESFFCDDCMEALPDTVKLTYTKQELITLNKKNTDCFSETLTKLEEAMRERNEN